MRRAARVGLFVGLLLAAPLSRADSDTALVRVGESTLTSAEVEQRLRALAPFQLKSLGSTPEEVKRKFVQAQVVPELLYVEESKRRKLEEGRNVSDRIRDVLRQALQTDVREKITKEKPVTPDEIKVYYKENAHKFNTPQRIKLWRILVGDEAAATKILSEVSGGGVKSTVLWTKLARDKSLDKATSMRDGDLGFVHPDGKTETPSVRVDPALFTAAQKLKDGQLVPQPVKEGERFAVVWRRGSMPAVTRTLAQEERTIRQILMRNKLRDGLEAVVKQLQKDAAITKNTSLLSFVGVDPMGDLTERARPGIVPRHKPATPISPRASERGLR